MSIQRQKNMVYLYFKQLIKIYYANFEVFQTKRVIILIFRKILYTYTYIYINYILDT